jgi:hypothetical protein
MRIPCVPVALPTLAALVPVASVAMLAAGSCAADLLLNEVLYDPAGADEGYEFVELWNPDSIPLPLDGVTIESGDGTKPGTWTPIWTAPAGASAPGNAPFLVTAASLSGAIQNGPDAIRLLRSGTPIDLLGYGELESPLLFQVAPAPDVPSGQSLARRADGAGAGSNEADWEAAPDPTPGAPNKPDTRVRLSRAVPPATPEVVWPGESVALSARVRNTGRLPIPGDQWMLEVEVADEAVAEAWNPSGAAPGVAIAPGESASVTLAMPAPSAGAHRVRLRLRAAAGVAPSAPFPPDTLTAAIRSVADPAVVNEICFRDLGEGEWVEIVLRRDVADLGSLSLADASGAFRPIDRGASPRPAARGEIVVIAQHPPLVRARFGLAEGSVLGLAGAWPSLNDTDVPGGTADRVRVRESTDLPSDAVAYRARDTARGGSLERLSVDLPSASPGTWAECVDPARGTPGRPNSLRAPAPEGSRPDALVAAGSRVLRAPTAGGVPLVLRATAAARGRRLVIRVHDLLGRARRTLVEGQRIASEAAFVWDGKDDAGNGLPPGLYLLRAEAIAEDGLPPRVSEMPLAVAAGPR